MSENSVQGLTVKVKRGIRWVAIERILFHSMLFVRIPILSYLLTPRAFGLMSIISTILLFLDVLTRTGFDAALVQRADGFQEYLDVGWSLSFLKGIVQTAALVLLLKPIVAFYDEPILEPLLLTVAVSVLFRNLRSIRIVHLTRELDIRTITLYNTMTNGIGTIATIGFAFWLRNVWALALGNLVIDLFQLVGSFIIAPYRPKFDFDMDKIKELWSYGKWVLMSGIFLTLFRHGDDLFVGKILGATALGYYATAYKLGNLVTTELVDAVRKVLFPAFSNLQNDIVRLRRYFMVSYQLTAALGGLFSLGLCLLAQPFVTIILGEKWLPMVPALRILAVWGGFQMLSTSIAPLFRAVGKPDWWTKVQIFKVAVLALTIYPLTLRWGITGTSVAVLIPAVIEIPVGLHWVLKTLVCQWRDILPAIWVPGLAIAVTAVVYLAGSYFIHLSPLLHLFAFGMLITALYSFTVLLIDTRTKLNYVASIKNLLAR